MSTEHLADTPHVVYRAYAYNGALLYVGCTYQLTKRLQQHRTAAVGWYDLVSVLTVQAFDNQKDAFDAEYLAINLEDPLFNQMGNGQHAERGKRFPIREHKPQTDLQAWQSSTPVGAA